MRRPTRTNSYHRLVSTPPDWEVLGRELDTLGRHCHEASDASGFWGYPSASPVREASRSETLEIAAKIGLIGAEVSELMEAWRLPDPFGQCPKLPDLTHFDEEIADILIRTLDLCAHFNVPVGEVLQRKLAFNETRAYSHGKRF